MSIEKDWPNGYGAYRGPQGVNPEGTILAVGEPSTLTVGPGDWCFGNTSKPFTSETYLAFVKSRLDGLQDKIRRKNSDYTNGAGPFANFDKSSEVGIDPLKGLVLRMSDKMQRIYSYCNKGELQVVGEGVEDSFEDLIGYSLIALAMLEEKKRGVRK